MVKEPTSRVEVIKGEPLQLWCDNKSAINIANNSIQHDCTKHVEIDRFFIKNQLNSGALQLKYVKSGEQLADCLAKGLGPRGYEEFCNKMGMVNIYRSS